MKDGDANSAWVVHFDDQDLQEYEVPEEDIGLLLGRPDDSDNSVTKVSETFRLRAGKAKTIRNKTELIGVEFGSGSESDINGALNMTSPSIALQVEGDGSTAEASVSSPNSESAKYVSGGEDGKVSSREVRSRRRQQAIEDEVPPGGAAVNVVAPPPKKAKTKTSDEVIKIPMLTGTLYLYRGAKRSVAFVRKV